MRYVYVGLHADGPTRVLCFSDRKDQYTQGTNEDNMAVLSAKLARLEARLKVTLAQSAAHLLKKSPTLSYV